jgi:hypothetical protein
VARGRHGLRYLGHDFHFAILARWRLYTQPHLLELFFSFVSTPNDSGGPGGSNSGSSGAQFRLPARLKKSDPKSLAPWCAPDATNSLAGLRWTRRTWAVWRRASGVRCCTTIGGPSQLRAELSCEMAI